MRMHAASDRGVCCTAKPRASAQSFAAVLASQCAPQKHEEGTQVQWHITSCSHKHSVIHTFQARACRKKSAVRLTEVRSPPTRTPICSSASRHLSLSF